MSDDEPIDRIPEPHFKRVRRPVLGRVFASLLIWSLALAAILAAAVFWAYLSFTAPGPLTASKIIEIQKGQDRSQISIALQDQGIISDARIFSAVAAVQGIRGAKLKAGEYEFPAAATMQDVLATIIGGRYLTYKVTIPEGWTSQMVVAKLQEQKELDGDISQVPAEGSILPDTYVFRRGLTRQKLLEDMQAAQSKMLDELWQRRPADLAVKSKEELVTLASIVEKETGIAEERPKVASVFVNRLKQAMRLQSDPTIIYGIVGGKGRLDRPLTRSDIDNPTPYNTYQIPALPPGPIANPGKAALEAVLHPEATPYLYFVADGTGGHAFATTLEEHNANVKKWRAQQNLPDSAIVDAPAVAPAPAAPAPVDSNTQAPQALPDVPATAPPIEPAKPAAATTEVPPEPTVEAKPGSTVTVKGKQVPIPVLKKPKK